MGVRDVTTFEVLDYFGDNRMPLSVDKAYHSMETALLTVQIDIFVAMERQNCTAITVLDLSAAFDMMNHQILLVQSHQTHYGITYGSVLRLLLFNMYATSLSLVMSKDRTHHLYTDDT